MQNSSNKIKVKKICQISESHCGPAVLQMLLSFIKLKASQEEITKACGVSENILGIGTRVDQLAKACKKLFPETEFWFKKNATLEEAGEIMEKYHYPVGVEWQGLFLIEEEEGDDDDGHYSVMIGIDKRLEKVILRDPYKHYYKKDRKISIRQFIRRWWDTNEIIDKKTNRKKVLKDNKVLFVVVLKKENFPVKLGLTKDLEHYFKV